MTLRHGASGPSAPFVAGLMYDVLLTTGLAVDSPREMFLATNSNAAGITAPEGGLRVAGWAPFATGNTGGIPIPGTIDITLESSADGVTWETLKTASFTGDPDIYSMAPEPLDIEIAAGHRLRSRAVVTGSQLNDNSRASVLLFVQ